MARHHMTADGPIPFTPEEELEWDLREEAFRLEQLEYAKTEYQRLRAAEYPSIGDQLDSLYHAGVFPKEMADKIKTVKDKYPKVNK